MNVLVVGGCGFIGSHVVDELLEAGHQVRVLDRTPERYREPLPEVAYHVADIHDERALDEALTEIDAVIHAASSTVPSISMADPVQDIQDNLVGLVRLLERMRHQNVRRILFLSSGGTVYGDPEHLPVKEDHPLRPLCSYGVVKVAMERYLLLYQRLHGFLPLIFRPSNPYGPRQGHIGQQGVVATIFARMAKGEPITIWGDGSTVRDYFHVSDLARLCRMAIGTNKTGIYNVGSGQGTSLNQLVRLISGITGIQPDVRHEAARPFDVQAIVLDTERVKHVFGWAPSLPLEEGLRAYWMEAKNT